ncbi:hypothetical protein V6N13_097544 [Hibiscus sabdariffa]|uniref:Uncharacterized protein n=1 Tax=Hibiscus sabdariffa TaxID=183260 RepID=A0ABR2PCY9_9ROSI
MSIKVRAPPRYFTFSIGHLTQILATLSAELSYQQPRAPHPFSSTLHPFPLALASHSITGHQPPASRVGHSSTTESHSNHLLIFELPCTVVNPSDSLCSAFELLLVSPYVVVSLRVRRWNRFCG